MGCLRARTLKSSVLASVPVVQLTNAVSGAGGSTFLSASMAAPWGLLEDANADSEPGSQQPCEEWTLTILSCWVVCGDGGVYMLVCVVHARRYVYYAEAKCHQLVSPQSFSTLFISL